MADPVTAVIGLGIGLAAAGARAGAADLSVQEQMSDIADAQTEYNQQKADAWLSANAQMKESTQSGIYNIGQVALESKQQTGTLAASQGYSGVRGNSPLYALQQQERLASEAVTEASRTQASEIQSIGRTASILTESYDRKVALLQKDYDYLKKNRGKIVGMSLLGEVPNLMSSVSTLATTY